MKGLPNMGNLLKKAQELQEKMNKLQEDLGEKTIETSAGGGMVVVVANGKQEIVSIKIDPEVVDTDDVDMLEDLVLAAVNDALNAATSSSGARNAATSARPRWIWTEGRHTRPKRNRVSVWFAASACRRRWFHE